MISSAVTTGGAMFSADFAPLTKSVFFESRSVDGRVSIEDAIARSNGGSLWVPYSGKEPDPNLLSRFFAKIGFDILAQKLWGTADFTTIIYDAQFDLIRRWARYGMGALAWPVHRRRIYQEDRRFHDNANPDGYQLLHEYCLLITDTNEWYAVVCLFGEEFVINLGGPEVEGYEVWLKQKGGVSPLYTAPFAALAP